MGRAHGSTWAAARCDGRPGSDWAMPLLLGEGGGGGARWRHRGSKAATAAWTRTAPWPVPGTRKAPSSVVRRAEGARAGDETDKVLSSARPPIQSHDPEFFPL